MLLLDTLAAAVGTEGATPDVWVVRITLITAGFSTVGGIIVAIIKTIQTGNKVDDQTAALAKRLDLTDAAVEDHHAANTASLAAVNAKLDALVSQTPAAGVPITPAP